MSDNNEMTIERIESVYDQLTQKLHEIGMTGEEAVHVLSRAIIAATSAMNESSLTLNYGNGNNVSVNVSGKVPDNTQSHKNMVSASHTLH